MMKKIETLRTMLANRSQELWEDLLSYDFIGEKIFVAFDRIKVLLENMIEAQYFIPSMWEENFVKDVDINAIEWMLESVTIDEVIMIIGKEYKKSQ